MKDYLPFNIHLMGMAEELKIAQLGFKLEGCWYGHLYAADVLVAESGAELQALLDVVGRWKMKFSSRKSKVMVVEKREAGESWKIGEEIVEEVEEFNS